MGRLRNRIILLVAVVAGAGILGTAMIAADTFVRDKRDYVMELNSIAAPNVAAAIGRHLDYIQSQFVVFDRVLTAGTSDAGEIIGAAFGKVSGVESLDVFDAQGKLASIRLAEPAVSGPRAARAAPPRHAEARFLGLEAGAQGAPELIYMSRLGARTYVATLSKESFSEYLEPARALSVAWIAENGAVILGARDEAVSRQMLEAVKARENQAVVAREVSLPDGGRGLAAISPIPRTPGSSVLAVVPATRASQMARQVFREAIPILIAILLFAGVAGVLFSSAIVQPVEDLTEAAADIAEGHWQIELPRASKDEIGALVGAFSRMGSELAKREQALKAAHQELVRAERLASLGQFGAGLAHEIKNPLNSILGFSQLLERKFGPGGDAEVVKYLGFIMGEARRASRIITDLLTFARQKPPVYARVDARELAASVGQLLTPQAQAAKTELTLELGESELPAELDRDQIFQVLVNLVTNAIHALEEKAEGSRHVVLRARAEGGEALFEIEDNGVGIPAENLPRIFEPFFSTKGVGKGTGLGLSLCHGIVEAHRGRIEVSSEAGQGTRFRVRLPLRQ